MRDFATIVDALEARAALRPESTALMYISESGRVEAKLSYADLAARAFGLAKALIERGARPGDRAMLVFPPGLDFLVGFFGCLAAGVIAVPLAPPRRQTHRDTSAGIVTDCDPRFALTGRVVALGDRLVHFVDRSLVWIHVSDDSPAVAPRGGPTRRTERSELAFLQYTSGSTSRPKGVKVSHANLFDNLEMIRIALRTSESSTCVSWAPLYHDMGLILNVLAALHVGAACVLMAPVGFLQRPLSWLRAIHDHGADVAGCPNFGFELCASRFRPEGMEGIDLSRWRVAFNGAEPVRAETLRKFAAVFAPYGFDGKAFYPCYGMAEATLLISGGRPGAGAVVASAGPAVVGCGRALAQERLAIVDPDTRTRLGPGQIGEIWVEGPNVAAGYWRNETATAETFGARIVGEPSAAWLRTGDLGYLDAADELFVTGRHKDLIIVRGVNHYPQDIEHTAQAAHPSLRAGFGAAFSVLDAGSGERVVLAQEVERSFRHSLDIDEVIADIREAVAETHELSLHDVALVAPGTIPKTTSGKIRRRLVRQLWEEGRLERLPTGGKSTPANPTHP